LILQEIHIYFNESQLDRLNYKIVLRREPNKKKAIRDYFNKTWFYSKIRPKLAATNLLKK